MTNIELMDMARDLSARGEPYALVTVVRAIAPTSAYVGAQCIVLADGTQHGWIGGGCTIGVAIAAAKEAIGTGDSRLVRISNDRTLSDEDLEQHAMSCASNGTIELFIQPSGARNALCVLGSTPAADEARFLAERLNLGLAETPDRARVVLVATQGQGDEDSLERALRSAATHVLMIASRRKTERLRAAMRMRGIDAERLERLIAPAGPDAGAKTPQEIALVSIAGVLAVLRGRLQAGDRPRTDEVEGTGVHPRAPASSGAPVSAGSAAGSPEMAPDKFINPVCGIAVSTVNPKHVETYEGIDYFFCCDGCWTTFRKEPAKYAAIHLASIGRPVT